jgi:hypothetical protein
MVDVEASTATASLSSVTFAGHVAVSGRSRGRWHGITAPALIAIFDTSVDI